MPGQDQCFDIRDFAQAALDLAIRATHHRHGQTCDGHISAKLTPT
jgi:hypothetical protein